ncbi:MalY/PatB family protein [Entomospira culicis]|uniref:cysteine-S-conjugate beta-lyase n=1 Tax=Entomospira culicis TaxID=2719989 RepID=A0A968GGM0_9SPIO|nr:MalY/PatB family protein [Entomospira culicis]NIZ19954.1 pyridoxal phosphate-dependent aminotransferase [Entomospira culicis]NIZ70181.1 pyridoxal phosphate-dependent aminotransferase [Entomospira culicis]WDI38014.1 pyridoxal phosphate-dependent aminotransferase [Entomospira culicis]WDI39637.1 pyridoxal phosphate-dependent aminotransferase [Entomospira culicis]
MLKEFDFDQPLSRKQTNSVKYDIIHLSADLQQDPNVIPMWVADMDLPTHPAIAQAISDVALKGIYGYSNRPQSYQQAIIQWYQTHYNYTIEEPLLAFSPCVMTSIAYLLETLVSAGEEVVIQTPVYPEFAQAIKDRGAIVVENPLMEKEGKYVIDFIDLEAKLATAKAMILCSPHNPVGRVWSPEELTKLASLIQRYQIPLIADEIHADLTLYGHQHYPFITQVPQLQGLIYTLLSASKTFNLASLHASSLIFPDKNQRIAFDNWLKKWHINRNNIFSLAGVEKAYQVGYPWLQALRTYLEDNIAYMEARVIKELPKLKVMSIEATYLLWVDCRGLNLDQEALKEFFYQEAKVIVNMGYTFGTGGEGFVRFNIATQRVNIQQALDQLVIAYQKRF